MSGMEWYGQAACADHPSLLPQAWTDIEKPRHGDPIIDEEVIQTCLGCPVFAQCDELATREEQWGVWAGRHHWERYGREPRYLSGPVKSGPTKRRDIVRGEEESA